MRILVVSPSYPPAITGESEHCRQIAIRLGAAGHEVHVLTSTHSSPAPSKNFDLQAVVTGWRWRDARALQRHVRQVQPDAVLLIYTAWLFDDHPMMTFAPTWLRRWRPDVRVLTLMEIALDASAGTWPVRIGRKLASFYAGRAGVDFGFGTLLRDSTSVAVLGPSILEELEPRCPGLSRRALVIPPPPLIHVPDDRSPEARNRTRLSLGANDDTFLLAYFGYVYVGKGVETLLRAVHLLRQQGRDVRLVMAGGGRGLPGNHPEMRIFEARMQSLAAELGIADDVSWPAGADAESDAMARDLMAADLAVLPFDDGAELRRSSIAVVAALGLPILTTYPARKEEAFVAGQNVHLCRAMDPEALADGISGLADDRARLQHLADGAAALARDWFSWPAATKKLLTALGTPTPSDSRNNGEASA